MVVGFDLFTARSVSCVSGFLLTSSYGDGAGREKEVGCLETPWPERKAISEHCHRATGGLFAVATETCPLRSPTASLTNGGRAYCEPRGTVERTVFGVRLGLEC